MSTDAIKGTTRVSTSLVRDGKIVEREPTHFALTDFYKPDATSHHDWHHVRQQPTVEFSLQFANGAEYEIKAIEIKWESHSPCPGGKLVIANGNVAITTSSEVKDGLILTQTFTVDSKLKATSLSIKCNDPGRRIMVRQISVYGMSGNGGTNYARLLYGDTNHGHQSSC